MANPAIEVEHAPEVYRPPSIDRVVLQYEIEAFLHHEADLLMSRRFDEWLELIAEDVHYYMPLRKNVSPRRPDKVEGALNLALFDDDKYFLNQRIQKIHTGVAWTEDPSARTTYMISNVVIEQGGAGDTEYHVNSVFYLHRNRLEHDDDAFHGRRRDVLRRTDRGFEIAKRHIELDSAVLLSKNLAVLF